MVAWRYHQASVPSAFRCEIAKTRPIVGPDAVEAAQMFATASAEMCPLLAVHTPRGADCGVAQPAQALMNSAGALWLARFGVTAVRLLVVSPAAGNAVAACAA